MSGLDHVGMSTADYETSLAFYERALAPLGITTLMRFDEGGRVAGLGSDNPFLWVSEGGAMGGKLHLCLTAKTRSEVDAFHAAALAAGGKDNGAPGIRAMYAPTYYAAYVFDPDGNNIEAVCHAPE